MARSGPTRRASQHVAITPALRQRIIRLLEGDKSAREIAESTGVALYRVRKLIAELREQRKRLPPADPLKLQPPGTG